MNIADKKWCDSMKLRLDYNNMMDGMIKGGEGITDAEIDASKDLVKHAFDTVQANRGSGMMGWADLPYNQDKIVEEINATAEIVRKDRKSVV